MCRQILKHIETSVWKSYITLHGVRHDNDISSAVPSGTDINITIRVFHIDSTTKREWKEWSVTQRKQRAVFSADITTIHPFLHMHTNMCSQIKHITCSYTYNHNICIAFGIAPHKFKYSTRWRRMPCLRISFMIL